MLQFADLMNRLHSELDRHRGRLPLPLLYERLLGVVSVFLYLRWLEQDEAEREAVAAFDETDYEPTLPPEFRLSNWSRFRGQELLSFITRDLPERLQGLNENPHRHRLSRLVTVLEMEFGEPTAMLDDEPTAMLDVVIEWVGILDLAQSEDREEANQVLEQLIDWATRGGRSFGEHITPQAVVDLMVELADPQVGQRIYDPCFGSGGLLVGCARRLRERFKLQSLQNWNVVRSQSIFGIELNALAYVVGLTRLVLAGIPEPGLELGDALERPPGKQRAERFDLVLASPPWGRVGPTKRNSFDGIHDHFRFPAKDSETLFLQHTADSLRPGGKAIIVLPEGILFRSGSAAHVRQWLLKEFRVDGVVSLPAGTFSPLTNIKANLLIFRREQPAKQVRFCVVHGLTGAEKGSTSDAELPFDVARRFRSKKLSPDLWETPIKDLARREYELVAKFPGVDQLQGLLDTIRETDMSIPINSLSSVADVFAGTSYDKQSTVDKALADAALPGLVRVSDIHDGKVKPPTLFWLGAEKLMERFELRSRDVVVSTSGSIGKVAVVPSSPSRLVASKSVVVIRPKEGVLPGYLAALLRSESYQLWLTGHARGSTIQHLSLGTLRHLEIPVPTIQFQERVSSEWETRHGDALSILVETVTGSRPSPWLESFQTIPAVWAILHEKMQDESAAWPTLLESLSDSLREARNRAVHETDLGMDRRSLHWVVSFHEALQGLRGLSRIPDPTARLSILEAARAGMARASRHLEDRSSPDSAGPVAVTRRIEEWIGRLRESLLTSIDLRATLKPEQIAVSLKQSEVILRLQNASSLPLRGVEMTTQPDLGKGVFQYSAPGQEVSVPLSIPPQEAAGALDILAMWRAVRLDGQPVSGSIPLRLTVKPSLGSTTTMTTQPPDDLGTSPYIVGSPVDRRDMFFGRDNVIEQIKRQLSTSQRANVLLLEGNRRTGKTSILQRLASPGELPDWIPVNCSFQGGEGADGIAGLPTREVFRLMAREIGWQVYDAGVETWFVDQEPPDSAKKFKPQFTKALAAAFDTERPLEVFELYLQEVIAHCRPRRILLMLDEFDKLQEGIDAGVTSPQVPENIRYLLHKYTDISAILTGSRRLKRLREEYWSALFGFGHRIGITTLPIEAARLLVTRPVEGRLVYVDEARDRLVQLCACHPFLVQSLCNRVFEDAARSDIRTVSVSMVETAAREMVQDNEHFRTLWDYAATEGRRLLLALTERLANGPDAVTLSLFETKFEEYGIPIPSGERLGNDVEFLRELELLDLDSTSTGAAYRLAVPLMGAWIHSNVDFDDLRQKAVKEGQEKIV